MEGLGVEDLGGGWRAWGVEGLGGGGGIGGWRAWGVEGLGGGGRGLRVEGLELSSIKNEYIFKLKSR